MNILITGANGQLGNELTSMLSSGQAEIGPIPAAYRGSRVTAVDVDRRISPTALPFRLLSRRKNRNLLSTAPP